MVFVGDFGWVKWGVGWFVLKRVIYEKNGQSWVICVL